MASSSRAWLAQYWWQLALTLLAAFGVYTYWASEKAANERAATTAEQAQRAYIAKRRGDCYSIFVREQTRVANVLAPPEYDPEDDVCRVRYKAMKADPNCARIASISDTLHYPLLDRARYDCESQSFTNEF